MYSHKAEWMKKHAKPVSQTVMPFFLEAVAVEKKREEKEGTGRCVFKLAQDLSVNTATLMHLAGMPGISLMLQMNGWMMRFVSRSMLAVRENIREARRKKAGRS